VDAMMCGGLWGGLGGTQRVWMAHLNLETATVQVVERRQLTSSDAHTHLALKRRTNK